MKPALSYRATYSGGHRLSWLQPEMLSPNNAADDICSHSPCRLEVAALSSFLWILLSVPTSPSSSHRLCYALAITMVSFSTDFDAGCPDLDRFSSTVHRPITAYLASVRPAMFHRTCSAHLSTLRCVSTCPWLAVLSIQQRRVTGCEE